ncbi:hypothetical protein ACG97_15405 [Vogesella sp. EB]|uniref:type IV pilin protein n=1 Tax=Vogesella sp. EB TaxID=1526735 RepID=UPI00064D3AC4|nr:type IV pilin protein [Vogesella sp. EB]KMJ52098.1 hypothetical protein ACG97_15405 [Vogesella sp. EB]
MLVRRGFTLLELLLVLALLGILSAAALPAYQGYVQRSQRAQAIALLQENAIFLEEFYHRHGSYKLTPTRWPTLPAPVSPPGGVAQYQLAFGSLPRNTDEGYYVLRATRLQVTDEAEVISLTQTGIIKRCVRRDGVEQCELVH